MVKIIGEKDAKLEALKRLADQFQEASSGELKVDVTDPALGTILDSPDYPKVYAVNVHAPFCPPELGVPQSNMLGTYEECNSYLHGWVHCITMLSRMSGKDSDEEV